MGSFRGSGSQLTIAYLLKNTLIASQLQRAVKLGGPLAVNVPVMG
jgi:methylenetetrahydrofolate dehydrogenase (NADP+)/methenyltetrahydrofolate cyclohydrolase